MNNIDNKVINGLWISPDGKPLSNLERLCIHSFCANGHDFRLWVYGDIPNIPRDTAPGKVEVRDGNEIISASKIFYSKGSLANFSDWFSWELFRRFGGWYVDMDSVCLRPFDFSQERVIAKSWIESCHVQCMKFPLNDSLALAVADSCVHPTRLQPWDDRRTVFRKIARKFKFWQDARKSQKWGEIGGGGVLTAVAKHFGVFEQALPYHVFNVVPFVHFDVLMKNTWHEFGILDNMLSHPHALHFCNHMWKKCGFDKNGIFPEHSPYEVLKRRYLPELQK